MRTRNDLIAVIAAGARPKYLHFWGHRAERDGSIGKGCLSQWWPQPFVVDGITYGSAEHWMMAGKARLFGDTATLERILGAPTAPEAKKLGRQVQGFDAGAWNGACFEIVAQGNVHKFGQDPALAAFLLSTGQRVLVEAAPRDRIWGIGMGERHEHASNPERWNGQNLLGFALMQARERLA